MYIRSKKMQDNIYNPEKLVKSYRELPHGKARADAIRSAIEQADLNNDIPYMVFFREDFCGEAGEFADELGLFTVFPELLALVDSYPDVKLTPFQESVIQDEVLWDYETMLDACDVFYQIPLKECIKFYNDYKRRYTAYGYSNREPYRMISGFYLRTGDIANTTKYFKKFKSCPKGPDNCPGCDANSEIDYYLFNGEKEKADKLASKIEEGIVKCEGDPSFSLLRMKTTYLEYYIVNGSYKKAAETASVLEYYKSMYKEFSPWHFIMCACLYKKPGKGLRIYKNHHEEWEKEHSPDEKFNAYMCAACFFKGLKEIKDRDTVKLMFKKQFPLYNGSGIYSTISLTEYYYKEAEKIAAKFDKRNGTGIYTDKLKKSFANVYRVEDC